MTDPNQSTPGYSGQPGYPPPSGYSDQAGYPGGPAPGQPNYPGGPAPSGYQGAPSYPGDPAQPGYPGAPAQAGYPGGAGQPGYQPAPPGYPPPGYSGPAYGAPAEPPKKSHKGLWITLAALLVLIVVGGGVLYATVVKPVSDQRGATVQTPATLAGLTKATDTQLQSTADTLNQTLKSKIDNATSSAAAFYTDPASADKLVMVVGVTGNVKDPSKEVNDAFTGFSSTGVPVSDKHDVDAGPLGGVARCGSADVPTGTSSVPIALCVWGDYGSLGMAVFYNRTPTESAPLFVQIRGEMLKRR
jgi:hypothetical protein